MRQKLRGRRPAETRAEGPTPPIDLGDTARQVALFETGNGWQHGFIEIGIAILAAIVLIPLRSFLRSGTDRRRTRTHR
jgi:hypothetical protein